MCCFRNTPDHNDQPSGFTAFRRTMKPRAPYPLTHGNAPDEYHFLDQDRRYEVISYIQLCRQTDCREGK